MSQTHKLKRGDEVYLPRSLKNWPKPVNVEKVPLSVPPVEKNVEPGVSHTFVQPPQIS